MVLTPFFVLRKFENEDAHIKVEFLLDMLGQSSKHYLMVRF